MTEKDRGWVRNQCQKLGRRVGTEIGELLVKADDSQGIHERMQLRTGHMRAIRTKWSEEEAKAYNSAFTEGLFAGAVSEGAKQNISSEDAEEAVRQWVKRLKENDA